MKNSWYDSNIVSCEYVIKHCYILDFGPCGCIDLYSYLNIINTYKKFNNNIYLYDHNLKLCIKKSNIK